MLDELTPKMRTTSSIQNAYQISIILCVIPYHMTKICWHICIWNGINPDDFFVCTCKYILSVCFSYNIQIAINGERSNESTIIIIARFNVRKKITSRVYSLIECSQYYLSQIECSCICNSGCDQFIQQLFWNWAIVLQCR